ncbi:MAG: ribonuclease E/G, partial [Pseudomonadota bacterium]
MKGRIAALDHLPDGRAVAALLVDGVLHDLLVDPPEAAGPAQPGAIFWAKVGRPMKGMGGAMVDLGGGHTGFLREAKGLSPGAMLAVQVTTVTEPGKAAPVTRRILFKSRYAIVTPDKPGRNLSRQITDEEERLRLTELAAEAMEAEPKDIGLILRSAAAGATEVEVAEDIAAMLSLARDVASEAGDAPSLLVDAPGAHLLAWREWADPEPDQVLAEDGSFEALGLWDTLPGAVGPRAELGQGAFAYIEPTRALVSVDVNTGQDTTPAAALKANVAALRMLPLALRLRGLAGQVTCDLAPTSKRERTQLEQVLRAAIKADGSEMSVAGWTPL